MFATVDVSEVISADDFPLDFTPEHYFDICSVTIRNIGTMCGIQTKQNQANLHDER